MPGPMEFSLVGLDHDRLVATLEQVSGFLVSPVEPLGVPQRDALHDFRKRDVGDLDLQVDVGGHEAERVDLEHEALDGVVEYGVEAKPILVVGEYVPTIVAP